MQEKERGVNWANLLISFSKNNGPENRTIRHSKNLNRTENIQLGSEIAMLRSQMIDYAANNNLNLKQPESINSNSTFWKLTAQYRNKVNELVEGNLKLVNMSLGQFGALYEGDNQMKEQLFMAGVDGLMYAARRYSPWEGSREEKTVNNAFSFSSYACPCIRGSILGYLYEIEGNGSRGLGEQLIKLRKGEEKLIQMLKTEDAGEIGMALIYLGNKKGIEGATPEKAELLLSGKVNYKEMMKFARWRRSILDKQTRKQETGMQRRVNYKDENGEWDSILSDFEASLEYGLGKESGIRPVEDEVIETEEKELIKKSLNNLTNTKEVQIITRLYGFNGSRITLEEAAQEYGFTRSRVQQIRDQGLQKIKRFMWGKGYHLEDIKS